METASEVSSILPEEVVSTKNLSFSSHEIETIVLKSIDMTFSAHSSEEESNMYKNKKVNEWTHSIITNCLKELQHMEKPFKYVVSCIIMQNNGAGLVSAASTYWDANTDGFTKVIWKNDTIYCLVTVFAACTTIQSIHDQQPLPIVD